MSNHATTLQPLDDGIHTCFAPCRTLAGRTQTTMSVIETPDGVVLYAPTPIDDALQRAIEARGPVRWIIAPNPFHNLYVTAAAARMPEARIYLADGVVARNPACGELEHVSGEFPKVAGLSAHLVALRGGAELILVSEAQRTAFFADLIFHVQQTGGPLSTLGFRLFGLYRRPGMSLPMRMMLADREAARRTFAAIADAGVTTLVPCHDEPIRQGAQALLRELADRL